EDIRLWIVLFGEQLVGETGALGLFGVVNRINFHAGLPLVGLQDRLGKDAGSGDVYSKFIRPLFFVTAFSNSLRLAGDKKCRQADQESQKSARVYFADHCFSLRQSGG